VPTTLCSLQTYHILANKSTTKWYFVLFFVLSFVVFLYYLLSVRLQLILSIFVLFTCSWSVGSSYGPSIGSLWHWKKHWCSLSSMLLFLISVINYNLLFNFFQSFRIIFFCYKIFPF
jgi:hypothetical protein